MATLKTLITPLDWGLGHATRCVPIILDQLEQGHEVHLASNGRALAFLKSTFPMVPCYVLPDYAVTYPKDKLYWPMLRQLPKIGVAILREHQSVMRLHKKIGFQQVISDQRYGCYIPGAFNAFITHQLHLPVQDWFGGSISQRIHEIVIAKRFQECWVPDWPEFPGLAGDLSHPPFTEIKTKYLGPLSRLKKMEAPQLYRIAFILSGPEPQRSIMEAKIREQVLAFPEEKFFLLQGTPEVPYFQKQEGNLLVAPHLDTVALSLLFAQSGCIVCRSGYSTLMDLAITERSAFLIPTPGQPEQEYLAKMLGQQGKYNWGKQDEWELGQILEWSAKVSG